MAMLHATMTRAEYSTITEESKSTTSRICIILTVTLKSVKMLISSSWQNPFENYAVSLAICDHTMLLVTQHKRTHPALTTASKVGTRFT